MIANKVGKWNKDSSEPPLRQLSRIADEQRKANRPTVPDHAWGSKPVFREHTANELTKTIITFIGIIGGQAERINSMGRQITKNRKEIWVYGTGTNGTADISATWKGMSMKIEVKATKGEKQSEYQKRYQESIERAGGIYILARSFDGFLYEFFRAVEGRFS
jgi:hypothetical protein